MTTLPASCAAESPGFATTARFPRALVFGIFCSALAAAEPRTRMFDIPPGNAEQTLKLYSSQSAREVIFATSTTGKIQTNRVKGDFTPSEALEQLLKNTGLIFKRDEASGILSVTRDPGNRRRGEPSANARPPGESQKKKAERKNTAKPIPYEKK
jgi:hypothetical protein